MPPRIPPSCSFPRHSSTCFLEFLNICLVETAKIESVYAFDGGSQHSHPMETKACPFHKWNEKWFSTEGHRIHVPRTLPEFDSTDALRSVFPWMLSRTSISRIYCVFSKLGMSVARDHHTRFKLCVGKLQNRSQTHNQASNM